MSRATMPSTEAAGAAVSAEELACRAPSHALTPVHLLQQLDGWLSSAGHGDEHPWRRCIAGTLANYGTEAPTVRAADVAAVFEEIAESASSLLELLRDIVNDRGELWGVAFKSAGHVGWLADAAALAHGGFTFRRDAADWFLSPRAAQAIEAAELATRAHGGAA